MAGELTLPSQNGAVTNNAASIQPTPAYSAPAPTTPPSNIVELTNMLSEEDLQSDQDYEEIMEDTKEECGQFGALKSVIIPRDGAGLTKIFLEYVSMDDAAKAIQGLAGRTFDGKAVQATYFPEDKFIAKDYS